MSTGSYLSSPVWKLGLFLVMLGSVFDFIALMFADQNVIAPLGALSLLSNMFFATVILDEKIHRKYVIATVFVGLGCALSVTFAKHNLSCTSIEDLYARIENPSYFMSIYGVIWIMYTLVDFAEKEQHSLLAFVLPITAATVGSQSMCLGKIVAMAFKFSLNTFTSTERNIILLSPYTYLTVLFLAVSMFAQVEMINRALRLFPTLLVVPIFQSCWVIFSIISGVFLLDNEVNVMFSVGVLITVFGLGLLRQERLTL